MFYILNISKEKLRDTVNSVCVNGLAYSFLRCKMLCKLIKIRLELHPQHVYVPTPPPKKQQNPKELIMMEIFGRQLFKTAPKDLIFLFLFFFSFLRDTNKKIPTLYNFFQPKSSLTTNILGEPDRRLCCYDKQSADLWPWLGLPMAFSSRPLPCGQRTEHTVCICVYMCSQSQWLVIAVDSF